MSKSRKISKEEKLEMVKQCLSGEIGVCEAGRQIGVNQQSVRSWIKRYEAEGEEGLTAAQGWRKYGGYFSHNFHIKWWASLF